MSTWVPGVVPGRSGIRIGANRTSPREPYSAGIVLMNRKGIRISRSETMTADESKDFYKRMFECLEMVRSLPTGAELIKDIDHSGHVLYIIKGPQKWADGSCVVPYPGDLKSAEERFVKQFRPPAKNKLDSMKEQGLWIKPKQSYTSTLSRLLDRVKQKNPSMTRTFIAALIGVPVSWLEEMEQGTRQIPDNEYYKLCLYLYDELESGKGSGAEMRVVFEQEELPNEPLWLIVGHELVHAWRIMKGRRIFENGWEEEAMTTGLPPFSRLKFSENRLRSEAKLPMRDKYAKICSTSLMNAIRDLHTQPAREDRPFPERDIIGRAADLRGK